MKCLFLAHRAQLTWATAAVAATALLAGCTTPSVPEPRAVSIQRTAYGVPHISAPDMHTLAQQRGVGSAEVA